MIAESSGARNNAIVERLGTNSGSDGHVLQVLPSEAVSSLD